LTDENSKKKIWVFSDFKNNGSSGSSDDKFEDDCNHSQPTECQLISILPRGQKIAQIFVDGNSKTTGKWNIIFKRPNPDARIIPDGGGPTYSKICLDLTTKNNEHHAAVEVGAAGDISVKKTCN
jgi:hypothetical protein